MGSSFIPFLQLGPALFGLACFIKLVVQFGLPNHPVRLMSYLVSACVVVFVGGEALAELQFVPPVEWLRWRSLPLVACGLTLLLQVILLSASFSFFQQKVIARIPLIGALLCFAFFAAYADTFVVGLLVAGALFLSISLRKARHQFRLYLKMLMMVAGYAALRFRFPTLAQVPLSLAVFYFFLFEQSFALMALFDEFNTSLEGDAA